MNKKVFMSTLKAKSPVILLAVGCIGVAATAVSAVFDKEHYDNIIEDVKKDKEEKQEEMKKTDVIKVVAKSYWRTAVIGVFSICCIIASNRITAGQLATVGAAYAASETKRKEFMEKATEVMGEKKVEEVKNKVTEEKMMNAVNNAPIMVVGGGEQLFYESWTGGVFVSDKNKVDAGINRANAELRHSDSLTINEWRDYISDGQLEEVKGGDLGWTTEFCNIINTSYYAKALTSGPYAGKTAWAIVFHTDSEPKMNIDCGEIIY